MGDNFLCVILSVPERDMVSITMHISRLPGKMENLNSKE